MQIPYRRYLLAAQLAGILSLIAGSASAVDFSRVPWCEGACVDAEFLGRVAAVAQAKVTLAGHSPRVVVERWLLPPPDPSLFRPIGFGPCVPDMGRLRALLSRPGDFINKPALRTAIKARAYSLIVFLSRAPAGQLEPYCAEELAIDWDGNAKMTNRLAWLKVELGGEETCREGTSANAAIPERDQLDDFDAAKIEGECSGGRRTGVWRYHHPDGSYEEGTYVSGKRDGVWRGAGPTGREEFHYLAGRRSGPYVRMVEDREIETGVFKDGLKEGPWVAKYKDGTLRSRENYVSGLRHGLSESYHPNGALDLSAMYAWGILHGRYERRDSAGAVIEEGTMAHGERKGRWHLPLGGKSTIHEF